MVRGVGRGIRFPKVRGPLRKLLRLGAKTRPIVVSERLKVALPRPVRMGELSAIVGGRSGGVAVEAAKKFAVSSGEVGPLGQLVAEDFLGRARSGRALSATMFEGSGSVGGRSGWSLPGRAVKRNLLEKPIYGYQYRDKGGVSRVRVIRFEDHESVGLDDFYRDQVHVITNEIVRSRGAGITIIDGAPESYLKTLMVPSLERHLEEAEYTVLYASNIRDLEQPYKVLSIFGCAIKKADVVILTTSDIFRADVARRRMVFRALEEWRQGCAKDSSSKQHVIWINDRGRSFDISAEDLAAQIPLIGSDSDWNSRVVSVDGMKLLNRKQIREWWDSAKVWELERAQWLKLSWSEPVPIDDQQKDRFIDLAFQSGVATPEVINDVGSIIYNVHNGYSPTWIHSEAVGAAKQYIDLSYSSRYRLVMGGERVATQGSTDLTPRQITESIFGRPEIQVGGLGSLRYSIPVAHQLLVGRLIVESGLAAPNVVLTLIEKVFNHRVPVVQDLYTFLDYLYNDIVPIFKRALSLRPEAK